MVRAGEASGKLEEVLKQLFVQMKKDHDIIAKVRGAMIYPAIVIIMMLAIGTLMMLYVIPTMTNVFKEINASLPLPTRILIAVSDFTVANGLWILIAAVALTITFMTVIKSPKGKYQFHQIILRLPITGK